MSHHPGTSTIQCRGEVRIANDHTAIAGRLREIEAGAPPLTVEEILAVGVERDAARAAAAPPAPAIKEWPKGAVALCAQPVQPIYKLWKFRVRDSA